MKNLITIQSNVAKNLKLSNVPEYGSSEVDRFIDYAKRYIKAIKDKRMICNIETVSASGMSRTLKFISCEKDTNGYYYASYFQMFKQLGFTPVKASNYFRVNGCGMDMVFATNYEIINNLYKLGLMTEKECRKLCQMTPSTI